MGLGRGPRHLTENLFIDNPADCALLLSKEGQQSLVDLHVDGIIILPWFPVTQIVIPGYADIWGLRLDKYQIHARFILLDTVTGYRSQYQQGAFCISV